MHYNILTLVIFMLLFVSGGVARQTRQKKECACACNACQEEGAKEKMKREEDVRVYRFKDRHWALIIFIIFTICMDCCASDSTFREPGRRLAN